MGNLLEDASNWLEKIRHQHTTVPVEYKRGSDAVEVSASIGRTVFMVDNGHGILEETESRDFLLRTQDLVLGSSTTLPKRGDKILEAREGTVFTYEVMTPGKEPHYRYSDPHRRTLRIHTKQVAVENTSE